MPVLTRPAATLPAEQLQGTSTPAEAFQAALDETWATGPTGALITAADIEEAETGASQQAGEVFMATRVGGIVPQAPKLSPRLSLDVAKQRVAEAGLEGQVPLDRYPNGIREQTLGLLIRLNQDKVRRQTLAAEYDGYVPGIAGMVVGSLIDPANVATAFVPLVGEARYAQLLARAGGLGGRTGVRVGIGAGEGAVGAALVEPAIYAGQQQWRTDYDAYDSMLNIAGGAGFGALLHGGAGMVKDAFGRPVQAPADIAPTRQPFADPDVYAADAFKAKARAQGVSESAIAALTPQAARDDVTGFFDGRQAGIKAGTVQRAIDHAQATGEPAYYVSADIYNLGGLNAAMGNVAEAANVHYRAMAEILRTELARTGADVVPLRTGGDELGAVVVNADAQAVADAMAAVDARVAEYAQREGLAEIPHPKRSNEQGVGLHSGVAPILPGLSIDDILRHADEGIDASKRGIDRVRRNEAPTHGAGPDTGGGAGRLPGEAPGGVRGEGADAAAAARAAVLALRDEIGWAEVGGRLIRADNMGDEEAATAAFIRTTGDAVGRTKWVPKPGLDGQPSTFWRDRPDPSLKEGEAREALAKWERGDKLTTKEQRFIDHAKRQAEHYENLRAEANAEYWLELDALHREEMQRWRDEADAAAVADWAGAFDHVRPFIADLDPAVQAVALRSAVTQYAEGRPVDVTPSLLAEADYDEAVRRALANADTVAAADPIAARQADERLAKSEPAEQLAAVRELLADTKERLGERGEGLEWESDLKTQRDAVKAATLCMMRNA
jgi:GGDEF domain-containing protein